MPSVRWSVRRPTVGDRFVGEDALVHEISHVHVFGSGAGTHAWDTWCLGLGHGARIPGLPYTDAPVTCLACLAKEYPA